MMFFLLYRKQALLDGVHGKGAQGGMCPGDELDAHLIYLAMTGKQNDSRSSLRGGDLASGNRTEVTAQALVLMSRHQG